jgi:uncharacterized protein (TIGR02246 family)
MDIVRQTTPPVVEPTLASTAAVLQRLVDEAAIRDLTALYAVARDDHDIDGLMDCFADDATFLNDGVPFSGKAALREFYLGNMRRHAYSIHIPHSQVIAFDSTTEATGLVTGHGEFANVDGYVMCAYRYNDRYVKRDGRWVFAFRDHAFVYAVPVEQLGGLASEEHRVRWPNAEPAHAEWAPRPV